MLDGQHSVLQGFFACFRPLVSFFLLGLGLEIVKETKLNNGFFLTSQTIFTDKPAGGHSDAANQQAGNGDAVIECSFFI